MIQFINFLDSVGISVNRDNYKVHLATYAAGSDQLEDYFQGKFDNYQGAQTKRNFDCEHVLSVIHLGGVRWLFAGVYEVVGEPTYEVEDECSYWWYNLEPLPGQEELIGRVVMHYKRTGRNSYRWGNTIEEECLLGEILAQPLSAEEFPGYNNVCVEFKKLQTIIQRREPSWMYALSNIKGIYLITDTSYGKHYVGKADGSYGIWNRWSEYVNSGHGGNVELIALLDKEGLDYRTNFQFSLLEIADMQTDDQRISDRESFWKNVLRSREFGYNGN